MLPARRRCGPTYTYDGSGRKIMVTAPDGTSATRYLYAGNASTVTDAAGKWKTYTNDAIGNLTVVSEPNPAGGTNLLTNYTYNGANQLVGVSMPRSTGTQTRTFQWSGMDLASATNPENGATTYTYDGTHRVLTRTDAKQQQTKYSYDTYGRLTQVNHGTLVNGTFTADPYQWVSYYYDSCQQVPAYCGSGQNLAGRLALALFGVNTSPEVRSYCCWFTGAYQYSYNQAGRVLAQASSLNASSSSANIHFNFGAQYGWDGEARLTSLAYNNGSNGAYTYGYDAMGRLNSMASSGTTITTAAYNQADEVTGLTYDSFIETRAYDPQMLQLTRITTKQNPAQTTVMDTGYAYPTGQNNGRISQCGLGVGRNGQLRL